MSKSEPAGGDGAHANERRDQPLAVSVDDAAASGPARGRRREFWNLAVGVTGLLVVALLIESELASIMVLAFGGLLFSIVLSLLTRGLMRLVRLPRHIALLITFLSLVALAAVAVWLAASRLEVQYQQFAQQVPRAFDDLRHRVEPYPWLRNAMDAVPGQLQKAGVSGAGGAARALLHVSDVFVAVITVVFVGLYVAFEPDLYLTGLIKLFPVHRHQRMRETVHSVGYSLKWWLIGQGITMSVLGTITGVGLWIIGVPLALLMALLSMLLSFVPTFGALLAYVPAALLALSGGGHKLVFVTFLWLFMHVVEGYILTPMIQRRAVLLPPALGILSQLVMSALLGITGLVFAYPLTIALLVIVQMLYVEDALGEDADVPGEQQTGA